MQNKGSGSKSELQEKSQQERFTIRSLENIDISGCSLSRKHKTVKFTRRPLGFSVKPHHPLGFPIVTSIEKPDLLDLWEMEVLKVGKTTTSNMNYNDLVELLKVQSLPLEITFGEHEWYKGNVRDKMDKKSSTNEPLSAILPSNTKLIGRSGGAQADEMKENQCLRRQGRILSTKNNRVSYLHEALTATPSNIEIQLKLLRESWGEGKSDSEGTSDTSDHEAHESILSSNDGNSEAQVGESLAPHVTRSISYDENLERRADLSMKVNSNVGNPLWYRPLSLKGTEGDSKTWSKMCCQRVNIIKELIDTEKSYLEGIRELHDKFLTKVSPILNDTEKGTLMNCVPQILEYSDTLLEELMKSDNIPKTFLTWGQGLRIFSVYVLAYTQMCVLVRDLEQQWRFKRYCKKNNIPSTVFYSNSILPVQRGPRYHLLLVELRKKTQEDHEMVKDLDEAVVFTASLCDFINKHGKILENQHHLFRISATIKEKSLKEHKIYPLVQPARRLVREGTVFCSSSCWMKSRKDNSRSVILKPVTCVLCNDVIFFIYKQKVRRVMQLVEVTTMEVEIVLKGKEYHGLQLWDEEDESLDFYTHELLEREEWSESINKYKLTRAKSAEKMRSLRGIT